MTFFAEFEDSSIGIVSDRKISKVSFICSIFKIFSMANLVVNDFAKQSFNHIKSGMPVNFTFVDSEGVSYVNKMKVLSFSKIPGPQADFMDTLSIVLISAIYFDKSFGTFVHEGSVGTIYDKIMSKFFRDSIVNYKGAITDDFPRRRFQTSERTLDFMKRIMKYGIKENFPVYLFHDSLGTLQLRGISEMAKEIPICTAVTPMNQVPTPTRVSSTTEKTIVMWNFISMYNGQTACSQINNMFTVPNFRFQNKAIDSYTFQSAERNNSQVFDPTPVKTKYYGWNLSPDDALAISARESFESTVNTCSFKATFRGLDTDNLRLGSTINVILPYDSSAFNSLGENSNLGEGRYLITDLEFSASGDSVQTIATLTQVAC